MLELSIFGFAYRLECMARLPKYSSGWPGGLLEAVTLAAARYSLPPNAEVWSILRVSDVRESLALLREGEGDSMPNFEGTDEGHGAAGNRAALDMPWESKDAGSGASSTDSPLALTGDKPRPNLEASSSRGEP